MCHTSFPAMVIPSGTTINRQLHLDSSFSSHKRNIICVPPSLISTLQYPYSPRPHTSTSPCCPSLFQSLCMVLPLFLQPIVVKITVGCENAEWLYISKITRGIYHCHWDTPTGMNWVKWEQCIGQGALTVTNAPPIATNRSVQIARGL